MSQDKKDMLKFLKNVDSTYSDRKPDAEVWNKFITFLDQNAQSEENIELYKDGELEYFRAVAYLPNMDITELEFRNGREMMDYVEKMVFKKEVPKEEKKVASAKAVTTSSVVANASGIGKSLEGRDDSLEMWKDLCGKRKEWGMERFGLALTHIMKALQGTFEGKLGELEEITQEQYEGWMNKASGAQVVVGPFMLMKLALQTGAFLKVKGDSQILSRNGHEVVVDDVYLLQGEVDKFATGLVYKGKTVGYAPISKEAYAVFDYIGRSYDIARVGPKNPKLIFVRHNAEQIVKYMYNNPVGFKHKDKLDEMISSLVATFNGDNIIEKDADMVIDRIARIVQGMLTDEIKLAVQSFKKTAINQLRQFKVTLEKAATLGPNEAKVELAKIIPQTSVKASFAYCEAMREARNRTDISQYSLKNVGSLQGSESVPSIDTLLKGARIRECMDTLGFTNLDKKCMYGVAYGHMIEPLKRGDIELQLFDRNPKKNSPYQMEEGNIFLAKHTDALIIDDTNTGKNMGEKEMAKIAARLMLPSIPKTMSGDEFKVMRFADVMGSCSIISKVTLGNVEKLVPILFPQKRPQPFSYVRLVKFGKLHNPEVFLILSNIQKLGVKNSVWFNGDAWTCASVSSMSNKIIQDLHKMGIGVGSLDRKVVSEVWRSIMKAMPRNWPWYEKVYAKEIVVNKTIDELDPDVVFEEGEREFWDDLRIDSAPSFEDERGVENQGADNASITFDKETLVKDMVVVTHKEGDEEYVLVKRYGMDGMFWVNVKTQQRNDMPIMKRSIDDDPLPFTSSKG